MSTNIITNSGRGLDVIDPNPKDILIEDIAHALSLQCRFNGHCKEFYSIAQHSLLVAYLLGYWGLNRKIQLAGLLHDASEYILGDVITPLKKHLQEYKDIESRVQRIINIKFGVDLQYELAYDDIKDADVVMLMWEREHILPKSDLKWDVRHVDRAIPPNWTFRAIAPEYAEHQFIIMFNELYS